MFEKSILTSAQRRFEFCANIVLSYSRESQKQSLYLFRTVLL